MKTKLIIFFKIFKLYKKKIFRILIYEIYFQIKYFRTGNLIRLKNIEGRTNTLPCPYYFIHKISQFINKKKIATIVDLGSGFGRVTNFLSDTTKATILGYEIDKEVCDISIKNKNNNVTIENKDVLSIDYKDLKVECFIIVDLFHKKEDFEYLIKKIELGNIDYKKKCYFIIINVDEKKMHILNNYKLLKYISRSKSRYIKFFSN